MKPKELLYFLGFRPKPRIYGFEIAEFDLAVDGTVKYAQWLHPRETRKRINQESITELRSFLRPGDVAIDIGAHTGDSTLPIAMAVGTSGVVLALEPNPYVFPVLEKNSKLNKDKTNILPLQFAATPSDGEFEFEYSDSGFCNGGMHEGISKWRHGHAFKLKVRGKNLQSYLLSKMPELWNRIRFVKVDAEGFDHTILITLTKLLREVHPFIKAEVYKHTNRRQRLEFFDFLADLGYKIHFVESDNNLRGPLVDREGLMLRKHFDIFCVPD